MVEEVALHLCEGGPSHGLDVVGGHHLPQSLLLAEGVQLDLVDSGHHGVGEDQVHQTVRQEVAHADGPHTKACSRVSMARQLPW